TQEDRWEEDAGYSPFTLAAEIAALLCAADFADESGEAAAAAYLRETAGVWNANLERWIYARDRDVCCRVGVARYYVRYAPVEMPVGTSWYRYNHDGYGEHADGRPFDGTGVGRAWPLLTGERAHYELAAGRREVAEKLLGDLEAFANESGFIPEQVWDAADVL